MKVTRVEELQSVRWVTQMKQILPQKAGRESGAKAFYEYEGRSSGSGNDREKERETTTGIYRNQCNIQFDHSAQGGLGKGESQCTGQIG